MVALAKNWKEGLVGRLDEALLQLELLRLRRVFSRGYLPLLVAFAAVFVPWVALPALLRAFEFQIGGRSLFSHPHWPAASLLVSLTTAAFAAAATRGYQVWTTERRLQTLETWILSRQQPGQVVRATIATSAAWAILAVGPLAIWLLVAAVGRLSPWQWLLSLTFLPLMAWLGAAAGVASFFIGTRLDPRRGLWLGSLALAALLIMLWLQLEHAASGWQRPWEEHPIRLVQAAGLLTPIPTIFSVALPDWWRTQMPGLLGRQVPLWQGVLFQLALMLALAAFAQWLSQRAFRQYWAAPDLIEELPNDPDGTHETGAQYYWKGFRNPVWTRDIRTRLRSRETTEFIFFASVAVAAGAFVPLIVALRDLADPLQTAKVAREAFFWLTLTLVGLITLIVPGMTAEGIAQERQSGTLDLLISSPLRPREILGGRAMGAICVALLLISPSLPLFGLCYLFHGAELKDVLGIYLLLFTTIAVTAIFGVTASAIHDKVVTAKIRAYALTAVFVGVYGGPFWIAAAIAGPNADARQAFQGLAGLGAITYAVAGYLCAYFWGNATERLEYIEAPL